MDVGERIGNYEVLGLLGTGAMASVYRVRHVQLGATYALKLLDHRPEALRERLLQEGRVQAQLRHPNIVTVTDVVELRGQPGLVMELVDGPTLAAHVEKHHPLPLDEVDALARGIMRGVRAAHQAGHLHRDLKPANILLQRVDGAWVPKIADFGLVKLLGTDSSANQTRSGAIVGSPAFMSPEQTLAARDLDARTDVWALGSVLYFLATGRIPFDHTDIVAVFSQVRRGVYADPRPLRPDAPARWWDAIEGCLTVEREHRIADCDELIGVWDGTAARRLAPRDSTETFSGSYLIGAPPDPRSTLPLAPPTATQASIAPAPRRALGVTGVAGVGAVAALVGVLGWAAWPRAPEPSEPPPMAAPVPEAPAAATPTPAPPAIAAPVPEPPRPTPRPAPTAPLAASPGPVTPAPATPSPEPPPPAAAAATGRFRASGQAEAVWLVRGGAWFEPGDVEAGTYTVVARFPGRPARPVDNVVVRVDPGATVTVACVAGFFTCRVE